MDPIGLGISLADAKASGLALFVLLFTALVIYLVKPDREAPIDFTIPEPEQCRPGWKGKVLEEPSLKAPGSTAIQCYAPATGELIALINPHTANGVDRAIAKARVAQVQWAKTSFAQRRKVLRTLMKFVLDNQATIAKVACLDSGKTKLDACFGEILVTLEKIRWALRHGEAALKPEKRPANLLMIYKGNEVRWEPLGVVAACVSWNYPFHNLLNPIITSIMAGNGIVVKGSEATAWSSQYFVSIAQKALEVCGHDPNLVQSVTCWPDVAAHLTSHPDIAHLTFIGSRPVAFKVAESAGKSLTPLCIELGGKDPAIILDDVATSKSELSRVTSIIMRGVFQSAGQNCIGIERIVACPKVYEALVAELGPKVKALKVGYSLADPASLTEEDKVDVGACISPAGFSKLESLIEEAVSQGARLLAGGHRYIHPKYPKGHYFQPTLLVDVTPSMAIAQEELFAPVALLMRADSPAATIKIANSIPYALGASVFSLNASSPDVKRIVRELHAGMVAVNDFGAFYVCNLPFGGVKGSGYGRFGGLEGIRSVCNQKAVCVDRWPGIRTGIPAAMALPVPDAERAWKSMSKILIMMYGSWTMLGTLAGFGKGGAKNL